MADATSALGAIDASLGKVREKQGLSLGSFTASLLAGASAFVINISLFLLLRARLPNPTYARPSIHGRTSSFLSQLRSLLHSAIKPPDFQVVNRYGIDAYFFLRYALLNLRIFAPFALLTNAILLPIHTIHGRNTSGGIEGLDRLSWANVRPTNTHRYWAHAVLVALLAAYVCALVWLEMGQFARFRQQQLTSPRHTERACSRTVLLASISQEDLAPGNLERVFGWLPGGVQNVWVNRDCRRLAGKIQEHRKVAERLEAAETELIRKTCRVAAGDLRVCGEAAESETAKADVVQWALQTGW